LVQQDLAASLEQNFLETNTMQRVSGLEKALARADNGFTLIQMIIVVVLFRFEHLWILGITSARARCPSKTRNPASVYARGKGRFVRRHAEPGMSIVGTSASMQLLLECQDFAVGPSRFALSRSMNGVFITTDPQTATFNGAENRKKKSIPGIEWSR